MQRPPDPEEEVRGDRRSPNCPARRSARSPTPASAAATCCRSGSARATSPRRSSSAKPRSRSLHDGETFYAHNLGMPELREALADVHGGAAPAGRRRADRRHVAGRQRPDARDAGAGRRGRRGRRGRAGVAQPHGAAGDPRRERRARVAASRRAAPGSSTCERCSPRSRRRRSVLLVNAPNNPTGWTLTRAEQQAILEHCRAHRHLDRRRRGLRAPLLRADAPTAARRASSTSPTPTTG